MIKFIHSCLNHRNIVCKSIVLSKHYCIKFTFVSNYKYLSCKYGISQDDWYTNLSQLVKKVNMKCHEEIQHSNVVFFCFFLYRKILLQKIIERQNIKNTKNTKTIYRNYSTTPPPPIT